MSSLRWHMGAWAGVALLLATAVVSAQVRENNSMNLQPAEPVGTRVTETEVTTEETGTPEFGGYREVSDFFNIREANSSVCKGEWELEQSGMWSTQSDGSDDDMALWTSLKYGVTDMFFVELEVLPLNLGDGGDQGNGDLALILFQQFVKESECVPAIAGWAEMRMPSGQGSKGVDASFHLNFTKTLFCNFRTHFEGWVETANGHRGPGDEGEHGRRHFQWGLGPGFDYSFDEKTIAILNYLMRSSEEYGHHNSNILELGLVRELTPCLHLKLGMDIGLDGQDETPNFATKFQVSYEFGGK